MAETLSYRFTPQLSRAGGMYENILYRAYAKYFFVRKSPRIGCQFARISVDKRILFGVCVSPDLFQVFSYAIRSPVHRHKRHSKL